MPCLLIGIPFCSTQYSIVQNDFAVEYIHHSNPFFKRVSFNASQIEEMNFEIDGSDAEATASSGCSVDVQLAWTNRLGAAIYSTPTLVPAPYGGVHVWSSTFVRFVEGLRGDDGHELAGWPYAFSRSSFHSSPLPHDIDRDGVDELILVSFDAEVVVLKQDGVPIRGMGLKLPKLRVQKKWYETLKDGQASPFSRTPAGIATHVPGPSPEGARSGNASEPSRIQLINEVNDGRAPQLEPKDEEALAAEGAGAAQSLFGDDIGAHGALSVDAESSFSLFAPEEEEDSEGTFEQVDEEGEARLVQWAALYEDGSVLRAMDAKGEVFIDAHSLSSPVLVDVDGDGSDELVVALSYFNEDDTVSRLVRHGVMIDQSMYVAGGVLALELPSGSIKWGAQLDLTTDLTQLRGYIYSAPTVVDLEADGELEVREATPHVQRCSVMSWPVLPTRLIT